MKRIIKSLLPIFLFLGVFSFTQTYKIIPIANAGVFTAPILPSENTISNIRTYIRRQALLANLNPDTAEWVIVHESRYCQDTLGDDGNSRGCWQISRIYHPEVSDSCAFDLVCSTDWTMTWARQHGWNAWSSWLYRNKLHNN